MQAARAHASSHDILDETSRSCTADSSLHTPRYAKADMHLRQSVSHKGAKRGGRGRQVRATECRWLDSDAARLNEVPVVQVRDTAMVRHRSDMWPQQVMYRHWRRLGRRRIARSTPRRSTFEAASVTFRTVSGGGAPCIGRWRIVRTSKVS